MKADRHLTQGKSYHVAAQFIYFLFTGKNEVVLKRASLYPIIHLNCFPKSTNKAKKMIEANDAVVFK